MEMLGSYVQTGAGEDMDDVEGFEASSVTSQAVRSPKVCGLILRRAAADVWSNHTMAVVEAESVAVALRILATHSSIAYGEQVASRTAGSEKEDGKWCLRSGG